MTTAVMNGISHTPTAHLQIKYVSRLPDTRTTSPFFTSLRSHPHSRNVSLTNTPPISATITDNIGAKSWTLSTTLRNFTTTPQSQSVKVYSWPMFEPEDAEFVTSASTPSIVSPGQIGKVDVEVSKRDLAVFDEKRGKWVLEEGIYMFEIKADGDVMAGMGVVKQVSVVGSMSWDR